MTKTPLFDAWRRKASDALRGSSSSQALQRYLEERDLPSIDRSTGAHAWLMELVRAEPEITDDLAQLLAGLLRQYADGAIRSTDRATFLYNLLSLCASLARPHVLFGPLLRLYHEPILPEPPSPESNYRGVSLARVLCIALVFNQVDTRLTPLWIDLLEGDRRLAAKPLDGFHGIVNLPGDPDVPLISWALGKMSVYLDRSDDREEQFQELLKEIEERFPRRHLGLDRPHMNLDWRPWVRKLVAPVAVVHLHYGRTAVATAGGQMDVTLPAGVAAAHDCLAFVKASADYVLAQGFTGATAAKMMRDPIRFACHMAGIDPDD